MGLTLIKKCRFKHFSSEMLFILSTEVKCCERKSPAQFSSHDDPPYFQRIPYVSLQNRKVKRYTPLGFQYMNYSRHKYSRYKTQEYRI